MEKNHSTNTTNIDDYDKWSSKFIFYIVIGEFYCYFTCNFNSILFLQKKQKKINGQKRL